MIKIYNKKTTIYMTNHKSQLQHIFLVPFSVLFVDYVYIKILQYEYIVIVSYFVERSGKDLKFLAMYKKENFEITTPQCPTYKSLLLSHC